MFIRKYGTIFWGDWRSWILLLLLLILHDEFGKDGSREQVAASKLTKESKINALEDCCESLLCVSYFPGLVTIVIQGFANRYIIS